MIPKFKDENGVVKVEINGEYLTKDEVNSLVKQIEKEQERVIEEKVGNASEFILSLDVKDRELTIEILNDEYADKIELATLPFLSLYQLRKKLRESDYVEPPNRDRQKQILNKMKEHYNNRLRELNDQGWWGKKAIIPKSEGLATTEDSYAEGKKKYKSHWAK